ncbi:MAG: hypothetical protein JJV98_19935 [Desulfosarcina sp.]|nr:hypothetical protein [Desulfobacterales bacterium]
MTFWKVREELSGENRLRRSYYELLRDELDNLMVRHALIDSYEKFQCQRIPFPFVERRELKPRARIPDVEYECQNAFLVLFVEDTIPPEHRKYIRFFGVNKTTKTNLLSSKNLPLSNEYDRNQKYLESISFPDFLKTLLPVDYALLIQRDPASKARNRYCMTHFHVRIDWPIIEAAENLARDLRYISKDIFERGDKYAEDLQKKFFEFYGLPVMAGGRRTAAIVAAQFLRQLSCISTVYAGSSETRGLIRISERGVSKYILMSMSAEEMEALAAAHNISRQSFAKNYVVFREKKMGICIFQATYLPTDLARPPDDGRMREMKSDLSWLKVGGQHIIPKPGIWKYPPLPYNIIYS